MGLYLLAIPVIAVLLFAFTKKNRIQHRISLSASTLLTITGAVITRDVLRFGSLQFGGIFYIDSLSIIVLDIVLVAALLVSVYSVGYLETEIKHEKLSAAKLRIFYILMYSFLFTMILALIVKNMGIMWFAIEATTLSSAFLVGLYNNKQAIEAAWKYVIIGSVGIAIALLGVIFLHLSSIGVLESQQYLDWKALYHHSKALNSSIIRLAFLFILVGFGTKAGLAPMHTWIPDAYSQAPTPIMLLSGVLLNSAMYAILRTVAIVNRNMGSSLFTGRLLMAFGILSILTAAIFILTQKDYKRLLAYSSIEHMGIIAVGIGVFTPLSVFGALFHMINHSLTKSMLFLSSGNLHQKFDTKQILKIKGVLKILPVTGTVFLLGLFAIAGAPPFSVFASEFTVIASIFNSKNIFFGFVFVLLLATIFAGIAVNLFKMFYGDNESGDIQPGEINIPGTVCITLLFVVITVTGLFIPKGMQNLILMAQNIVMGV
ncbi:MAG: hydrogenase 4 subunit F [Clostridiales bacterium]|nr:hydrogenase 4 subunit F [Clostridiales bacterium]